MMNLFNRKPKKVEVKEVSGNAMSVSEMATFLVDAFPELQESFTRADIELALDDRGWLTPGTRTFNELDPQTRLTLLNKARLYWLRDPLAKQAVRLWTDYALGDGMTYKADDDAAQAKLDTFCQARKNRKLMNSEGQRKSSKKLLIDGEVFFAIFDDGNPSGKCIRRVDPVQITDFITDPDDDETVLAYRRLTVDSKILYYQDWACDEEQLALLATLTDPHTKKPIVVEKNVVMYPAIFDSIGKRGNGLLSSVVDWSREHRKFMEARVAITAALAKFAWKADVKGGQAKINQIQQRLQSTYAASGPTMVERNPPNAPGGIHLQNEGFQLAPMPRSTGASDANSDGNGLKLMVSAGTGIMLHYFGDPSTGNLATATAMELPMLKMFASYQKFWIEVWRDIFSIVLDESPDEEPEVIDIDMPAILEDDLTSLAQFLTSATAVFPELKVDQVLMMVLSSLNINNVSEVMEDVREKRLEIDAKNQADQQQQIAVAKASAQPQQQPPYQESKELIDMVGKLVELLG